MFYRRSQVSTLSSSSKQELVDLLHFRPDRISLAPAGVDPEFSPKGERSPFPLVVAVGRLMPSKGFDDLIRIAARVRETVVDLQLVIAGEGYDRETLTDLIDDLGAGGWVDAGRLRDRRRGRRPVPPGVGGGRARRSPRGGA